MKNLKTVLQRLPLSTKLTSNTSRWKKGAFQTPSSSPQQHSPEEIKLISDMRRRDPDAVSLFSGLSLFNGNSPDNVFKLTSEQRRLVLELAKTNWTAYILGIAVILATVIFMFFLSWNSGEKQKAVNEEFAGRIKEMFY